MKNVLFILIISLLASCDGPYKDCPEYYFSDDFKVFTDFNENSYWVYEDTILGLTDSVVLQSKTIQFIDYCDYNTESQEILQQTFTSSFINNNTSELHVFGFAYDQQYNPDFNLPQGVFSGNNINPESHLDSIEINGQWFKDIRVFKSKKYESYWAKNIGLIRKVFPYPYDSDTVYHFDIVGYNLE